MSQDKGNRRLIECLALAREQQNAPHQGNETTTSNDCIDPRLLALSHDAVIQEEDVHASSSTARQTGSAVSQRNYLGSPSDDSAPSESGCESVGFAKASHVVTNQLNLEAPSHASRPPQTVTTAVTHRAPYDDLQHVEVSLDLPFLLGQESIIPKRVHIRGRHVFYHPLSCHFTGCRFSSTESKPMRKDHLRQHIRKMHLVVGATSHEYVDQ